MKLKRRDSERAAKALEMREAGERWQVIADELGFSGPGAAYNAVAREQDPKYWAKREGKA